MEKELFNMEPFHQQLIEKLEILKWLIKGSGIHGILISAVSSLTKEWIVQHYNVEIDYFTDPK